MIYPITPIAKPRMTRRDKWAKRPAVMRYRAFCDECRLRGVTVPEDGAMVTFVVPMPKSWSKKKQVEMLSQPHTQRPDLDNFIKALLDAIHDEDSHIHMIAARKLWGFDGSINVSPWSWGDPWPERFDAR